ncbi:uncharacterized protein LOC125719075 [Brienomyrus brachyistius]|uniref:uncharacterized protein LOC125719075 n=1 Tax=Brienomyrus brachyistius TaxID=42636 RepID=UPI0020B20740|nr:uncharacterized protein LOC125719075 [Brienomyrus brachyistius]
MDGATAPPAIPEALLNEIDIINNANNNENDADYSAQDDSPPAASDETVVQEPCFLPSLETLRSMLNERGSEAEGGLPPSDEVAWSPADSELWEALSDVEFLLDAEEIENELGLGQFENVEQEGGGGIGDVDPQPDGVVHRRRFNNVQIRRILNIPRPRNEGNFREYYENVIEGFQNIVNEAIPYAAWGAYIQVTLRADFLNDELSQIVRYGVGELTDLQQLLDRLVQSNQEILNDSNLEVIVDVINIPRGGGNKRKLQTMLASEIISKKAKHMFIINNDTNACFAINLAHLLHENLADAEAEKLGLELQEKAGFNPDHTVALNDIINFEKIIDCKAVVYYQQPYSNNLQIYQTPTPTDGRRLVYFFLHNQHFYGIKTVKGFLGVGYVCTSCFKGFDSPHSHRCEKFCSVYQNETMTAEGPDCTLQFLRHFRVPFYRGVCFISHYGKAFDNYIILNAMVKEGVEPRVVQRFLSDFEPPEPLRPREALFGGRTSAIRLRYDVTGQERVRYVDFTSLYPTCAIENRQEGSCGHSNAERELTGVWISAELNLALDRGYSVVKVHEQQASGYPDDATDDEGRREYINNYLEREGIELEPDKIVSNEGKRQVFLQSAAGKD